MNKLSPQRVMRNVQGREIDLRVYFSLIKKKLWLIIIITAITSVASYYYSAETNVPVYEASTRVVIGEEAGNMDTLMVMVEDPIILEKVKSNLGLQTSARGLSSQINVSQLGESEVIEIIVTDLDASQAAAIANETATSFKIEVASILGAKDIQLLSPAIENPVPINNTKNKLTTMGFLFGLITAVGLIFLLDSLDSSIRNARDAEEVLGVPVLGTVSNMKKTKFSSNNIRKHQKEIQARSEAIGSNK